MRLSFGDPHSCPKPGSQPQMHRMSTASYMVCATQRSGSGLLCEALFRTGIAGRPEEYFCFADRYRSKWGVTGGFDSFVEAAIRSGSTKNGVFGFKHMAARLDDMINRMRTLIGCPDPDQPRFQILRDIFPGLRCIWVTRRNKVRQAISLVKASKSGDWVRDGRPLLNRPVEYDVAAIQRCMEYVEKSDSCWREFFKEGGLAPSVVVYEDFIEDYDHTVRRLLSDLQIAEPLPLFGIPPMMERQSDETSEHWYLRFLSEKRANSKLLLKYVY